MTAERLREILCQLGWSKDHLQQRLRVDPRVVRRWISGGADIPESIALWLERAAVLDASNPPPVRNSAR
ncbi:Helix-turn-helix transcriptional regulator [Rhodovastum atsumiense]|uniref:Helix-turn-helix transcriptional regulator n=1 Tax=Rhodovastum atsumiense TaxID=504468 RepID=A0A5M6IZU2_9PROT|nr:helix-turn-helix transcriptional regulator [Rhodovastum atsumiense]KAA5613823.1 helix-turn-helix transcriptional regulator [Rhodovastum atsumiense]CAH2601926.1 Helix-turn-helix transcriptional regulator [Rhodovastum atsumiense]